MYIMFGIIFIAIYIIVAAIVAFATHQISYIGISLSSEEERPFKNHKEAKIQALKFGACWLPILVAATFQPKKKQPPSV